MLVEIRGERMQSMVPPSTHPEGGTVQWVTKGLPAVVESQRLLEAVQRLAATALIAQYWPAKGSRQEFVLYLSGWLLKHLERPLVAQIVREAAKAADDDSELDRREQAVDESWKKHTQLDNKVSGLPSLLELVPSFKPAVSRIEQWLDLASSERSPESEPTPIRIRSARDIASQPEAAIEWYWPGWVPKRGVAVIHGPGGDRKSFLALALALGTAAGQPLFAGAPSDKGTALYVSGAGENPEREDNRRLGLLCRGYEIGMAQLPFHFITAESALLGNEGDYRQLVDEITKLRPSVVVLDSTIALADLKDENDNAGVRRFLQQRVVPLARTYDCTVLLLAHSAKPSQQRYGGRPVDEPRGAGEWRNAAETVISVRQESGTTDFSVVRLRKLRIGKFSDRAVRLAVEDTVEGALRVTVEPYDAHSGEAKTKEALIKAVGETVELVKIGDLSLKELKSQLRRSGHTQRARREAIKIIQGDREWPMGQYVGEKKAVVKRNGLKEKSPILAWDGAAEQEAA
jgi:hypothetical protein